ncbi:NAD(P)-binding protein [Aspergillus saccharolyticus JOP 1030-1]|uniref:NAD(P)-binding protein n=1 Tax=Aspergillus saccharolyticus JOP 1030-1 TaxID=1450539 RepID=A0A318YZ82_9EURO|nr:NAD(P)-binding protein [Aspergillus saccharolyticus JOP 1030-1]PYH40321.1 NAD(P)-binding protein [Aspergillus saccharolyticus JOP 1030-1]
MTRNGELVFITGGSGHVGFRVLVRALEAGYRVRAAVRSPDKAQRIRSTPSIQALHLDEDRLSFVQVPDLTVEGAYDQAIQGAHYAIHVASPIPQQTHLDPADMTHARLVETMIDPAVRGTLGLLKAAQKAGSVRRVVITSSGAAIVPWSWVVSGGGGDRVFDANSRVPSLPAGYKLSSPWEAYAASKVAALNEAEQWLAATRPAFDVVHLFPGFVIGRDELARTPAELMRGSNQEVLDPVVCDSKERFTPNSAVHVDDVAEAHVRCLDPAVPGNQGFILAAGGAQGINWQDSLEITARRFRDEVESGLLPNTGQIQSIPVPLDVGLSEKVLGIKFRSFEDQVVDIVSYYLQLVAASEKV